jgi:hypothetical protein
MRITVFLVTTHLVPMVSGWLVRKALVAQAARATPQRYGNLLFAPFR